MSNTQELTLDQEDFLIASMLRAGIERDVAEGVLAKAQVALKRIPREPDGVQVYQRANVVERGATVIGYQARNIG